MMKLITVVLLVLAILPMSKAAPNPPESAPTYSPEKAPTPSVAKLCIPTPPEVEFGCAAAVEAHYYLRDLRIQPECCFAIFRDEDCVAPRLSGLQLTPFGQDLKNYCSTLHS